MALSDIIKVDLVGSADNEEFRNTFFYRRLGGGTDTAQALANWENLIEPKLQDVTCSILTYVRLDAVNLGDPTDFATLALGDTGNVVTQSSPFHTAINFTYKLNTRAVRPGSKRITGIPENVTTFNVITDVAYIASLELLRAELGFNLRSGGVDNWKPVVVKRIKYVPDPAHPTRFAYRLPETDLELVFGDVVAVLVDTRLSHQVSRGNGR